MNTLKRIFLALMLIGISVNADLQAVKHTIKARRAARKGVETKRTKAAATARLIASFAEEAQQEAAPDSAVPVATFDVQMTEVSAQEMNSQEIAPAPVASEVQNTEAQTPAPVVQAPVQEGRQVNPRTVVALAEKLGVPFIEAYKFARRHPVLVNTISVGALAAFAVARIVTGDTSDATILITNAPLVPLVAGGVAGLHNSLSRRPANQ